MDFRTIDYSGREHAIAQQQVMTKVFGWMTLALVITGITSFFVASSPRLLELILGNRIVFFGLLIGELVLVGGLSARVHKMSAQTATLMFIIYSILNGLTLSVIFLAFTLNSIVSTFFITAGTFAGMSIYGYVTKEDLSKVGRVLIMALWGVILASVVNFFAASSTLDWIISYAGVFIFVGLTAWDVQKIKALSLMGDGSQEQTQKVAIMGALTLYLDFVNLFLFLLRIFGRRD